MKAEKMPAVIPGSFASPEAIDHIMVQKFVMASPAVPAGTGTEPFRH
ncbi:MULTISPECIES: hypothetical protein [Agathobaculum]|uniref:Uncharacterized protein n=1 Tax=Agathobaculum ammoniilyticum TaxID=2981778 RepID=A0ABT2U6R4_9FIRM|nr:MULTISPECIES: hypothetical protein [Agathobaculum]MCU6790309.1 hypothetical protein [Agathobaculum ammoniilyticum]